MDRNEQNHKKPTEKSNSREMAWESVFSFSNLPAEIIDWIEQYSNDLVTVCNDEGEILYISRSIEKMLGYSPEYIYGNIEVGEFLSSYDRKILLARMKKMKDVRQKFRFHLKDSNGKYIWTETEVSLVPLSSKEKSVYIGITKDITDRKEVEEMMIRSEKLSVAGQLAAGIAHEIRNPLTSIKGFLQLLQAGIEGKKEYYKIMEEEIQKIETITSELLFISKPLTDDKKMEKVSPLLKDVIVLLSSEAKMAGIEISLNIIDDPVVICDRSQIKQVLINLLKNAIESMESGGKIEMNIREDDSSGFCIIDVIDEGDGISPEIIHKLTEPFFTTKKNGTGLGLMITNEILQRHGGRLDIYLPETKKGSHFQISLPVTM